MKEQKSVEGFRLTKDQKQFQKQYKKLANMAKAVQGQLNQQMLRAQGLGQVLRRVTGQMQLLQQQAPQNPIHEAHTADQPPSEGQTDQGGMRIY